MKICLFLTNRWLQRRFAAGIVAVACRSGLRFLARFGERPKGSSAKLLPKTQGTRQLQAKSPRAALKKLVIIFICKNTHNAFFQWKLIFMNKSWLNN